MTYLYSAENPYAPERSNGMRGWYYPTRNQRIRMIVLHTAETTPTRRSALAVGKWQRDAATQPSSYHSLFDSHNTLETLPDDATAFHVKGFNSISLGMSWATRAAAWGKFPEWDWLALERGAKWAAEKATLHGIPVRELTLGQAEAGSWGFARHSTLDPSRRYDPGHGFPMDQFLRRVAELVSNEEDDVALTPNQEAALAAIPDIQRQLDWIVTALGPRYNEGSQGGDEQLTVGGDLERLRRQS